MKVTDSFTKRIVAAVVLVVFVYIVICATVDPEVDKSNLVHHIVGVVEGALVTIVSFYFGSSKSSQDKDKNKKDEVD